MKRHSLDRLFDGNKVVLTLFLFAIQIIIETTLRAIGGGDALTIDFWEALWIISFFGMPMLPLSVCQRLWKNNHISEETYIFWTGIPMHFLVSAALINITLFIGGLFVDYFSVSDQIFTFLQYTIVYIAVILGAVVIAFVQTAKVNRSLKKIQEKINRSD